MTTPAGAVAAATVVRLRSPLAAGVFAAGGDPLKLSWSVTGAGAATTQVAYEVEAAAGALVQRRLDDRHGGLGGPDRRARARAGARQPRGQVRAGPDPDRARLVAMVGRAPPRGGIAPAAGLGRPPDHAAGRRRIDSTGAAAVGAAVVLPRRVARLGPVVRHGARAPPGHAQRQARLRRPVGPRLDRVPAPPPGGHVRRHRAVADGENVIGAAIGDGWYRGRLGYKPGGDRSTYGPEVALIAQLEVRLADGSTTVIATDEAWRASTGEIRSADLYDGCAIDLRERRPGWDAPGFDARAGRRPGCWRSTFRGSSRASRRPCGSSAVRPATRLGRGPGRTLLDGGQNIAGYVRLTVRGSRGTS